MNTPVSYKIAKLLKEKGFEGECRGYYYFDTYFKEWSITFPKTKFSQWFSGEILAPTIAEVVMWLYEKHGVWIIAHRTDFNNEFYWSLDTVTEDEFTSYENFNSPTEAYEASIIYSLNNLISNP